MLGEIWNAGTSLVGKGKNLLSGNGWKEDLSTEGLAKMMRKNRLSEDMVSRMNVAEREAYERQQGEEFTRAAAQSDLDREMRRFTSKSFMDAANRSMAMDEQNRQIAQQGAQQAQSLAAMYPEIWAAKRKARYQTGALSALGGV